MSPYNRTGTRLSHIAIVILGGLLCRAHEWLEEYFIGYNNIRTGNLSIGGLLLVMTASAVFNCDMDSM